MRGPRKGEVTIRCVDMSFVSDDGGVDSGREKKSEMLHWKEGGAAMYYSGRRETQERQMLSVERTFMVAMEVLIML